MANQNEFSNYFETIDLSEIDTESPIRFIRAEIPNRCNTPLVLVRYAINQEVQNTGMRLDLDKGVFLDRPFSTEWQNFINGFAKELTARIGAQIALKRSERNACGFSY